MKLSIIIPHFNSSSLLRVLLSSIPFEQDLEVLVVDDNSDECEKYEVVALQKTFGFSLHFNKKGIKGAGTCRNIGLENATGEWLLFADSDDFFTENMWKSIQPYFDSNYDLVLFKPHSVMLGTQVPAQRHTVLAKRIDDYLNSGNQNLELDLRYKFFPPWSKLIRRALVEKHAICFDEVIASNDVLFSTKVGFAARNLAVSKDRIYVVTRSGSSLTRTRNQAVYESRVQAFIRRFVFLKQTLSQQEFDMLAISGLSVLANTLLNYGVSQALQLYKEFRRVGLPIISRRDLDISLIALKIKQKMKF